MSNTTISLRGQAFIIIMLAVAGIVMVTLLAFMFLLQAMGPFLAGTLAAVLITVIAVLASKLIHNRFVKIP
jgi:hypothetical protein